MRVATWCHQLLAGSIVLAAVASAAGQPPQQAPGPIRSRVTVVPLDVRVLDANGNPVTDLTREDFTIVEDGVPQTIAHFAAHRLAADPALVQAGSVRAGAGPAGIQPVNRRVFLLMLGRGRHQSVTRSLDALDDFLRTRLLPQDQVALLAWNRTTGFMTDHAVIARTVRRYREQHERIETRLREWFRGLRVAYGHSEIPPFIQNDIDAVFAEARALRARASIPAPAAASGAAAVVDRTTQDLLTQQVAADYPPGKFLINYEAQRRAELVGMEFEDYVAQTAEMLQDVAALLAGIEYLRHVDGEKHLVLFTGDGLRLPRYEDSVQLASVAADARIALDTIYTGGVVGSATPRFLPGGRGPAMTGTATVSQLSAAMFATRELRTLSDYTGGQAAAYTYGSVGLDRIDRSSRFQYLLAYNPTNTKVENGFRNIDVRVNRRGVSVHYRRGYFAGSRPETFDRQRVRAAARIAQAIDDEKPIEDLKVRQLSSTAAQNADGDHLTLQFRIDISALKFVGVDGLLKAQLDLAIFCRDAKGEIVKDVRQPLDLTVSQPARERLAADGAPMRVDFAIPPGVRSVKIVVYDPAGDLLGSAVGEVGREGRNR